MPADATPAATPAATPTTGPTDTPDAAAPGPGAGHPPARALVAELNELRGELERRMGVLLVEADAARVVATMPVEGNRQPFGLLHGGASVVLAETAGSIAAVIGAPAGSVAVGIEVNATHHRSLTSGTVTAVATRVHGGRTLATYDIRITDEQDRPVCTARLTCMVRAARPGEPTERPDQS